MPTPRTRIFALAIALFGTTSCGGSDDDPGTGPTGSFTMTVTPSAISVNADNTGVSRPPSMPVSGRMASAMVQSQGVATLNVQVTRIGGYDRQVRVQVDNPIGGVSYSDLRIGSSGSGTFDVIAGPSAPAGTSTMTLRGTGTGAADQTAQVQLTIVAQGTIGLAVAPIGQSIRQGQSGTVTATLTRGSGFTGAIAMTAINVPSGVTVNFNPASAPGGSTTSTGTITVGAAVPVGAYTFTAQASGTGVDTKTVVVNFTVNP